MWVPLSRLHRRGLRKNLLKKLKQLTRLQAQSPGWLRLGFPVTSAGNSCWPTRIRLLRQLAVWPGQGSELRQPGGGHTCLQATTPSLSGNQLSSQGAFPLEMTRNSSHDEWTGHCSAGDWLGCSATPNLATLFVAYWKGHEINPVSSPRTRLPCLASPQAPLAWRADGHSTRDGRAQVGEHAQNGGGERVDRILFNLALPSKAHLPS